MRLPLQAFTARRTQAGLTLIEFMISIVLGMVIVAAMAMLIGNQSAARSEVDRSGRLIENGRYAITTMVEDLQMAGYWGEIYKTPEAPTSLTTVASLPNPCRVENHQLAGKRGKHGRDGRHVPVLAGLRRELLHGGRY